jgi:cell division protease FtsH
VRLGGRAAEILVLGEASTGAANDLAGATQLATHMVRDWGMSPKLGPIGFSDGATNYLGTEDHRPGNYAELTQRLMDEEVSRLLSQADQQATELLSTHRQALDHLIALLEEKETIDGNEIYAIANLRAADPRPAPAPATHGRHPAA